MFMCVTTQHSAWSVGHIRKLGFSSFSSLSVGDTKIKSSPCALNNFPVGGKIEVNKGSERRCIHVSVYKVPETAEHISTGLAHIWEIPLFLGGDCHTLLELAEQDVICQPNMALPHSQTRTVKSKFPYRISIGGDSSGFGYIWSRSLSWKFI